MAFDRQPAAQSYQHAIVAVNAILVVHVGKTGRRTVARTPLGLRVPSRCDTSMDDQDTAELLLQHELHTEFIITITAIITVTVILVSRLNTVKNKMAEY